MDPNKTHAFLIAVNEYPKDDSMHDLPHAYSNVKKLYDVLKSPLVGIPATNITTITNPTDAKDVLVKLRTVAGSEGIKNLIIYYAGHGILDDNGNHYLTLTDSTVENIDLDGLDISAITKSISKNQRVNVFLILDSCFSENAFNSFDARNFMVMASSAKNRTSKYPVDADFSAFTNAFVKAMENGIDNDQESLTWRQVYSIAKDLLVAGDFPKPKLLIQNEVDEMVLVKNAKLKSLEELKSEITPKSKAYDVENILDEFRRRRADSIKKQMEMKYTLLEQYQEQLMLTEDPKRRMKSEREIEDLQNKISKSEQELKELFE
jgi:uncharacterized caspase-like protein